MKTKFDILQFNPCLNALRYYETEESFEDAWNNCPRSDWMLWISNKLGVDIRLLTLTKAHCANTVRHLMKDQRSIDAVNTAIRYGNDEATEEELEIVAYAAYDAYMYAAVNAYTTNADYAAAYAAYDAVAYTAAYNAADAAHDAIYDAAHDTACDAYAAYDAANAAAYAAAYAAYEAAYDAYDAAYDATYTKKQLETADICRKYLTNEVFNLINKK